MHHCRKRAQTVNKWDRIEREMRSKQIRLLCFYQSQRGFPYPDEALIDRSVCRSKRTDGSCGRDVHLLRANYQTIDIDACARQMTDQLLIHAIESAGAFVKPIISKLQCPKTMTAHNPS